MLAMLVCSLVLAPSTKASVFTIYEPVRPNPIERLAAKELRRYLYVRTGQMPTISTISLRSADAVGIVIDNSQSKTFNHKDAYRLKLSNDCKTLTIMGGSSISLLYGAYEVCETFGIRYGLHGDVLGDTQRKLTVPQGIDDDVRRPLFSLRGIQPFHDFPEGPDWWGEDEYLAAISQLPKLRMNFIGLHTYPEPIAEPTVWIGLPNDVKPDGKVDFGYQASYQNTLRGDWGYAAKNTSDFSCGADQLFERDAFSSAVMDGFCPKPSTPSDQALLFNRTARLLRSSFDEAHRLGIKTCVGTETPLTIPSPVKERIKALGIDPASQDAKRLVYQGTFKWLKQNYPVDYYWMWTPEGWTWSGNTEADVKATLDDINAAIDAAKLAQVSFRLATCGWVVGPVPDRAIFDQLLPKEMPISCINRSVGKEPVDMAFASIKGRSKWAIPWLEDDPALTQPQLWVGRMRRDATDALSYGCDGLMGIHWRTRSVWPNLFSLSKAAWDQSYGSPEDIGWQPVGGNLAGYGSPIEGTNEPEIYQTVRWGLSAYRLSLPNGSYRVILKFSELAYDKPGNRVFDVLLNGKTVIEELDIFAKVGKNHAYDAAFPVEVTDGVLKVGFNARLEYPCIAAIVVEGEGRTWEVNCAGSAINGYDADGLSDPKYPTKDLYLEWCAIEFGSDVAIPMSEMFAKLDGRLPRPIGWTDGPGGLRPDERSWKDVRKEYGFVAYMESLATKVQRAGAKERFNYWLSGFQYLRAVGELRCVWSEYNKATSLEQRLEIRHRMVLMLERIYRELLEQVSTTGELGTIANWEQHILPGLLEAPGKALEKELGKPLPADLLLRKAYVGPLRVVVPTVRTMVRRGQPLRIVARLLSSSAIRSMELKVRSMGKGGYRSIPFNHIARGVYRVELTPKDDIEYFIECTNARREKAMFPVTAPTQGQTVIVAP